MAKHLHNVVAMRTKLERLALIGLSKGGTTLPEEKAQTRHSELESTEVLLIRAYQRDTLKQGTWVTLLNGERLWVPQNGRSLPKKWREISATLMQNTLKVTDYLAPKAVNKSQINWLGDYFYLGKPEYEESDMLRVALVGDDEKLNSLDGTQANDKYQLSYNAHLGYISEKRG
jgi:CRISPR-associated endonuclease/helicase Cas3